MRSAIMLGVIFSVAASASEPRLPFNDNDSALDAASRIQRLMKETKIQSMDHASAPSLQDMHPILPEHIIRPKSGSALGTYLLFDFAGRMEKNEFGQPELRRRGLVEAFDQELELPEIMEKIEALLKSDCESDEPNGDEFHVAEKRVISKVYAKTAMLDELLKGRKSHGSKSLRRLALIAFLMREGTDQRVDRIFNTLPVKNGSEEDRDFQAHKLATNSFMSEFQEGFAGPIDAKESTYGAKRIEEQEGEDALEAYERLVKDMQRAAEVHKLVSHTVSTSGLDTASWLKRVFEFPMSKNVCNDNATIEAAAKEFAKTLAAADWSPESRKLILETILGDDDRVSRKLKKKIEYQRQLMEKAHEIHTIKTLDFERSQKILEYIHAPESKGEIYTAPYSEILRNSSVIRKTLSEQIYKGPSFYDRALEIIQQYNK